MPRSPRCLERDGLERLGITDDGSFMRRWVEHYAELAPSTHWFEGAEKMLDDLSGAGFTLGIVTSRDALEMDRFFSQYDLPSRFGTIVIADDTRFAASRCQTRCCSTASARARRRGTASTSETPRATRKRRGPRVWILPSWTSRPHTRPARRSSRSSRVPPLSNDTY